MTKKKNTAKTTRCKETMDLEEWLEVRATMAEWAKNNEAAAPHNEDQGEGEAGG